MSIAIPLCAALTLVGVTLLAQGLRLRRFPSRLTQALLAYTFPAPTTSAPVERRRRRVALRPLVAAAWETAARVPALESHMDHLEVWLTRQLVRADLALTARELALLALGLAAGGLLVGWALAGTLVLVLVSGVVPLVGLVAYMRHRQGRRVRRFGTQLPDVLSMLIIAVRSGQTTPQALQTMSQQIRPPAAQEFATVVREIGLGVPADQALGNLAARIANEDLRLLVTAIKIQREKGGNLVDMLVTIEQTVRQRVVLRRMVGSLTAQARMGAWIITLLPVGLAGVLYLMNPSGMAFFWTDPLGMAMGGGAGGGVILGNVALRKITRIEL
ncbi:MAG: type II secretion system F family protein [Chloroflexota bacterium]|nr:type II secretion system F family protein [Chloroflexota bacterium]